MSRFASVPLGSPIEVFALTQSFNEDTSTEKINLGVGAYRTNDSQPWVLPVVRLAEKAIANDDTINKEYAPVLGYHTFSAPATRLLLGAESIALQEGRAFGMQTLSGTGALRVGFEFLNRELGYNVFYVSEPTWGNHKTVGKYAGFDNARTYRYWSDKTRSIDMEGFLEDLENAPENAVIVLHTCAHNPTGADLTQEQWIQIADVIERKKLFPFFDCAYQGFASGDLDKDAWSLRYFVERGFELFCAQSFAKNFGLYNERVGNLIVVLKNSDLTAQVKSKLTIVVRAMYSNPPAHGARIVAYVLNNPDYFEDWKQCIKVMADRIINMRKLLRNAIEKENTPGTWSHITSQIGMFSYLGLNEKQSEAMTKTYHIYMLRSGRISMAGVTTHNVDYIAKAIKEVVTNIK